MVPNSRMNNSNGTYDNYDLSAKRISNINISIEAPMKVLRWLLKIPTQVETPRDPLKGEEHKPSVLHFIQ